jgi:hypothetical protein
MVEADCMHRSQLPKLTPDNLSLRRYFEDLEACDDTWSVAGELEEAGRIPMLSFEEFRKNSSPP